MDSGIYQIENQINGKRYIGSAVNVGRRCEDHLRRLRRGQHKNRHLQNAFNKQGERAFGFSLLESVEDSSQLICREQHYLDTLKPEYNLSPTARSNLGIRYTEESCRRMSQAQKGRTLSKEHRRKIGEARKGMRATEETRAKMSAAGRGRCFSEEHKRKIGEAQRGKRHYLYGKHPSEETRRKMSEAHKGERNAQYGKPRSMEHCRKLSESLKAYWRRVHTEQLNDRGTI